MALKNLLDRLKLSDTGTVFFHKEKDWHNLVPQETKSRLDIIKPTAFYIFNRQPLILLFDLTSPNYDKQREDEIHKQVWSFDQSPVVFILKDGDIEIYNAFAYEKRRKRLQKINIKDEEINKQFTFWNLQSGTTWEWIREDYYKDKIKKKRVSQKLFENIRDVREKLTNAEYENTLSEDEANTLILRLIFIRYLIDRDVKLDSNYISGSDINERRVSFIQLLRKPRVLNKFFALLNEKFNGVLFKDIKFELSKEQANDLAGVFSGEIPDPNSLFYGSNFFFEVFDFSIIPVELISGIYESLIAPETRKLHSAVYTPPFLVEFILTDTVDEFFKAKGNKQKTECKIFDPSVGSGIFLVQSYRRMIDREIALKKKVSKVRMREIAENNLFGIDINEQALKVTCFSIYIAMLDYQDPKTILDNFHFPKLIGANLFEANFFNDGHEFNSKIIHEKVDFILGNPPWKSDKDEVHIKWLNDNNKITGRYEIAQSFLFRSKDFMTEKTISALIVTSTVFYNVSSTTKKFKRQFLSEFCIDKFFDLSPVRRLVFEEKNSPCAIVYYRLSDGDNHMSNIVKHESIKSNIFLKYYKSLVIEKFDQKEILQKHFIENDWMFKVALYGGSLDFNLFKKMSSVKTTLDDIIDNKDSIFKGSGIKRRPAASKSFPHLVGMTCIENSEISKYFTPADRGKKLELKDVTLESARKKELFIGNQILLKAQTENESEIVISIPEKTVVFTHDVFGIATAKDPEKLFVIYSYLISNLNIYFQFLSNCSWGIATRPAIRLEEYLSFPYIEPTEKVKEKFVSYVQTMVKDYHAYYEKFRLGNPPTDIDLLENINSGIEKLYQIKNFENDLIDYVLDVSRYQFQESKQHHITRKVHANENVISDYSSVFFDELKLIYDNEFLKVDVYFLNHFIALNFTLQSEEPIKKINMVSDGVDENEIFAILSSQLSITQKAKDLYIQRDIKGIEENSFYIIKPNEYKCWHRAMAWYDVAEIKGAIEEAEIDYLKSV